MTSADFSWLKITDNGLFCSAGNFLLDPQRPCKLAVVSHGHGDHYANRMGEVHATAATLDLGPGRKGIVQKPVAHSFHEPFHIGEVRICFYPAGHIPGSAQVELTYGGQRILYSGDISLEETSHCETLSYAPSHPDLLICESTFTGKEKHLSAEFSLNEMLSESGSLPILAGTYPVGKAQRITLLANKYAPEMPVYLHPEILKASKICEDLGYPAGKFKPFYRKEADRSGKYLLLVPPRILSSYALDQNYFKVFASGWDKKSEWKWLNGNLFISDHADADSLRTYIRTVMPKNILFNHGKEGSLPDFSKGLGISVLQD